MKTITEEQLKRYQSPKGVISRESFKALGVPWPPPKGWKNKLLGIKFVAPRKKSRKTPRRKQKTSQIQQFYRSYEWKKLRYTILKRDGHRCLLCGVSSTDGAVMNVDHVKPLRKYWELRLDPENLQTLCAQCNHGKGNWDETNWRDPLTQQYNATMTGE